MSLLQGIVVAVLVAGACRADRERIGVPDSDLLIAGVSIVDPTTNSVSPPRDILVSGGTIVDVAAAGTISGSRAATVYSAAGSYALAGLIDVHAHVGDGGVGVQSAADREAALAQFVRYGVTSIFVPGGGGGNDDDLVGWKKRCGERELLCPGIYGSGALITAPGSHPIGTIWVRTTSMQPSSRRIRSRTS